MEPLRRFVDILLHLDAHLLEWIDTYQQNVYWILFAIVFCETGLVVTPFLPGDSLLFAVGALSATEGSPIKVVEVTVLLIFAAVIGDAVNYWLGRKIGPKVFTREGSRLFNKQHLVRTQRFYEKHGGKTIILARFVPIVRTFAPFVAGVGAMGYRRFALFNVVGGVVWVVLFIGAGNLFGNIPAVQRNFHLVVLGIIAVSLIPVVSTYMKERRAQKDAAHSKSGVL
jgi:membrane-associated protein